MNNESTINSNVILWLDLTKFACGYNEVVLAIMLFLILRFSVKFGHKCVSLA